MPELLQIVFGNVFLKILLVGNYPHDAQVSMHRFAEMLASGFAAQSHEVRLIAPRRRLVPDARRRRGVWKWLGYLDKFVFFVPELRKAARWADLIHICDHSNAMYVWWLRGRSHIVTCHDVIAIRSARFVIDGSRIRFTGRVFQSLILKSLASAAHIACVSLTTHEQLLELVPEVAGRTEIIPMAIDSMFRPSSELELTATLERLNIAGWPYFLHVGSALPRKNRNHVVAVFASLCRLLPSLPHRLVLVGAPRGPDLERAIVDSGVQDRVVFLGSIEDAALRDVYSGASALIFPSLYEGFGWPIVEAQACGCPVFVLDRRPMVDVAGSAAVAIDGADAVQAARTIAATLPHLDELRAPSLLNASQYALPRMLERYLAAYRVTLTLRSSGA